MSAAPKLLAVPSWLPAALLSALLAACGAEDSARTAALVEPGRAETGPCETGAQQYPQLSALLEQQILREGTALRPAGPPQSEDSAVNDLLVSQSGPGEELELSFSYRNSGDYNQDGRVTVNDLSVVGAYLDARESDTQFWPAAELADGNADGLVSPQDLTPIGSNLNSQVDGYLLEYRVFGTPGGGFETLLALDLSSAVLPPGGGRLRLTARASLPQGRYTLRATPYMERASGQREGGVPGAALDFQVLGGPGPLAAPLQLKASPGLYGDRVQLSWVPSPGADRHLVYRDGGAPIAVVGPVGGYADFGLADFETHEYFVRAERGTELSPPSQSASGYLGERPGWPQYGGNAQHQGRGGLAGPAADVLRWSYSSTDLTGRSAPVVAADGSVYLAGRSGTLYCVWPSGFLRWSVRPGPEGSNEQLRATPALGSDGSVLLGGSSGRFYCLSQSDGALRWSRQLDGGVFGGATLGPLGRIYVQAGVWLYCLSAGGEQLWRSRVSHSALDWLGSAALGPDGRVYINALNVDAGSMEGYTHALTPAGELLWSFPSGAPAAEGASPAVGIDGKIYTAGLDVLHAIRPDGSPAWQYYIGGALNCPAVAPDGTVLVNGDSLYAINPDGSLLWQRDNLSSPGLGSPCCDSLGNVFVPGGNAFVVTALSPAGQQLWQRPADGIFVSQPALSPDGSLLLCSADGRLLCLR